MTENEVGKIVVDAAIEVHKELGPGLLESVYEISLAYELEKRGLKAQRQLPIAIRYKDIRFDVGFKADIVVEEKVVLELKSVEKVIPSHKKQIQSYLKLMDYRLGFLLNFGEALMVDGITRCVNKLKE